MFQLFAYFATSTAMNVTSFFYHLQGYLMQAPKYNCTYEMDLLSVTDDSFTTCDKEQICAKDNTFSAWAIDLKHE